MLVAREDRPDVGEHLARQPVAHVERLRDGALDQYVSCDAHAWHAGVSNFFGRERCNDFSIGIELEGSDATAFEPAQYETLAALVKALA